MELFLKIEERDAFCAVSLCFYDFLFIIFEFIKQRMKCPKCGSRDIDFLEAGGQSICVSCGTVVEESTIVSSIEFQVRKRF